MEHPGIIVRSTPDRGVGVFATQEITKGELITSVDGNIYTWVRKSTAFDGPIQPEDQNLGYVEDHAIQFGPSISRMSDGGAILLNHSCSPNVGFRGLFDMVAMRTIKAGEELCWDYAMTEDNYWSFECCCGEPNCRGQIGGGYEKLSDVVKWNLKDYTSAWLIARYGEPQEPAARDSGMIPALV